MIEASRVDMGLETLGLIAAAVIALDAWAVTSVAGSLADGDRKTAWIAAIVLLPLAGFVAWLIAGPRQANYTD